MSAKKIRRKVKIVPAPFIRTRATKDGKDFNFFADEINRTLVIEDPYIVDDFEATGLRLSRLPEGDAERIFLYLISQKSPGCTIAKVFLSEFMDDVWERRMGAPLAQLARRGLLRAISTHDGSKLIIQVVPPPEAIR